MSLPNVTGIHSILPCNAAWYRETDPATKQSLCCHTVVLDDGSRTGRECIMDGAAIVETCFRLGALAVLDGHFYPFLDAEQRHLVVGAALLRIALDDLLISAASVAESVSSFKALNEPLPERHKAKLQEVMGRIGELLTTHGASAARPCPPFAPINGR